MRNVIKNVLLLVSVFTAILFSGCCKKKSSRPHAQWMETNGKIKILSTIAQIGDLVEAIGGERVDCRVLVPAELDPHSYELVKGDGEKLFRADLIFYNGLGLEHGASLDAYLKSTKKGVALGEEIRLKAPGKILEKNGVADPHIWMDVSLWRAGLIPIAEKLGEIDPAGLPYYLERAASFGIEMEKTDQYIRESLQKIPSSERFLVTSHDAFRYFVRSYLADPEEERWEERFTAPEGLAPDGQMSSADIRRAITFLREHQIHVVFPESNVNRDAVAKIASASCQLGFQVSLCQKALYGDSSNGLSYLDMMRKNGEIISHHLRKR